jgi:hypothetical protein
MTNLVKVGKIIAIDRTPLFNSGPTVPDLAATGCPLDRVHVPFPG